MSDIHALRQMPVIGGPSVARLRSAVEFVPDTPGFAHGLIAEALEAERTACSWARAALRVLPADEVTVRLRNVSESIERRASGWASAWDRAVVGTSLAILRGRQWWSWPRSRSSCNYSFTPDGSLGSLSAGAFGPSLRVRVVDGA
jgi:hypothetical protein